MVKRFFLLVFVLIIGALALAACGSFLISKTGADSVSARQTEVMSTVSALLTQQAFETLVAEATQPAPAPPAPGATNTQAAPIQITPSATTVFVTAVPTTVPTATATQIVLPCNSAGFVKDVSVPDGTEIAAGAKFTKTWRLVNSGTCTWTTAYDLVFVDGSAMGAPAAVAPVSYTHLDVYKRQP